MNLRRFFWQTFITYIILIVVFAAGYAAFVQFNLNHWYALLVSAFITFAMAVYLTFRVSGPVERLRNQVEKVASGYLEEVMDHSRVEALEIQHIMQMMDKISKELKNQIELIRKQKDEQEAVFVSMDEGVFALDTHNTITHFNPAAGELFGLKREEVIGQKMHEVIRIPELQKICEAGVTSDEPIRTDIYLGVGKPKWIEVHLSVLHDKSGQKEGLVVVVADVTRIRELEGMRKNFVANVSHELRTPLTAIQGFAETLMSPAITDFTEAKKFIEIIQRHAERLSRIIEDILRLSRLERDIDNQDIELKNEKLFDILKTVYELCLVKAGRRMITIQMDCPEDIVVNVDRFLFEQALINLVDNAIRYSDEGRMVSVKAERKAKEVLITVTDQGPGIAEKHLQRIFERFYRVDRARSREAGGTGLGLSIVKHVVQAHGGTIQVSSRLGDGSAFTLSLPAA